MIGRLHGVWSDGIVDVGGVGYLVTVPRPPADGTTVTLHIHTQDTGGTVTLYGFVHSDEIALFRTLIAIPGVGPGAGSRLLESHDAGRLTHLITSKDVDTIAKTRGVGRKTAERIVQLCDTGKLPASGPAPEAGPSEDAVGALVGLGWLEKDARSAVARAEADNPTVDVSTLLRAALGQLPHNG